MPLGIVQYYESLGVDKCDSGIGMVCLLVLCGMVGLVTLGNPAPAYPASHNDQPIPAVIIIVIIIINILFFNTIM